METCNNFRLVQVPSSTSNSRRCEFSRCGCCYDCNYFRRSKCIDINKCSLLLKYCSCESAEKMWWHVILVFCVFVPSLENFEIFLRNQSWNVKITNDMIFVLRSFHHCPETCTWTLLQKISPFISSSLTTPAAFSPGKNVITNSKVSEQESELLGPQDINSSSWNPRIPSTHDLLN